MKFALQLGIASSRQLGHRPISSLRATTCLDQGQGVHCTRTRTALYHDVSWRNTSFVNRRATLRSYSSSTARKLSTSPPPSPAIPPSSVEVTSAKNDKIACMYFDRQGRLDPHHRLLTKTQIAEQFELRHRDLREVDLKTTDGAARILVRPRTILLQFFHLAMIIQADEALLINNVNGLAEQQHQRHQSGSTEGESHDDDGDEHESENEHVREAKAQREAFYRDFERRMSSPVLESGALPELPYELRAVEAALVAVLSDIHTAFVRARTRAEEAAESLRLDSSGAGRIALDVVFERAAKVSKIEQKARLVRDTIREVLDTDEDLAGMYLSDGAAGRAHAVDDHQEAEYMLEAYHKAADALVEAAQAVVDTLRKKENTFRSSLAVQRNQIMFLEARVAIHTLGLAAGTMVAGLFGMNLVNYLEDAAWGFVAVGGVCVVLSAAFSALGMRSLWAIQSLKGIRAMEAHRSTGTRRRRI